MSDHTTPLTGRNSLTLNKFTWRFLAISRSDRKAKPCRMSVEAHTEREARQVLAPHFILSLASRLPVQGMGEISTPSTIAKTSTVQEVSYA
ncbi:host cell division inhibitor Icd-like protein [Serratia sp. JSRIV002]|nr:host cell division inhibitor Icd-like protein [Serratia sp. JSRIV002]